MYKPNYSSCLAPIVSSDNEINEYFLCNRVNNEIIFAFKVWLFPISITFLLITLYIYLAKLKELQSLQDIAFMFAITCLMLYMILYMIRHTVDEKRSHWATLAYKYIGRYFKTAYFSWFNMMLWSRLIENWNL